MAYQSDESGAAEIYVTDFPAVRRKQRISAAGGVEPRWRHDGKELYYVAGDGAMMAVSISNPADLSSSRPAPLFKSQWRSGGTDGFRYAVLRDGSFW